MTSTVKVTAHCSHDKHVLVLLNGVVFDIVDDSETKEYHIYDEREISVKEVSKVIRSL